MTLILQKVGLALLVLYLVQLAWGAIIHFFKPASFAAPTQPTKEAQSTEASSSSSSSMPSSSQASDILPAIKSRPIQNYLHATNGIAIIALAFYNVRYGYHVEWPRTFGTTAAFLRSLNSWWISWTVVRSISSLTLASYILTTSYRSSPSSTFSDYSCFQDNGRWKLKAGRRLRAHLFLPEIDRGSNASKYLDRMSYISLLSHVSTVFVRLLFFGIPLFFACMIVAYSIRAVDR